MKRFVCLLLLLMCSTICTAAEDDDGAKYDAARNKAREYLFSILQPDRAWEPPEKDNPLATASQAWGPSALAALALAKNGEDPANDPRFANAVDLIAKGTTKGVYALGLRLQLLNHPVFKGKYKAAVNADFRLLLTGMNKNGTFHYTVGQKTFDLSTTYFGWCGLMELKAAIPETAWRAIATQLLSTQLQGGKAPVGYARPGEAAVPAGGWNYTLNDTRPPTIAMTGEALTLLLNAKANIRDRQMKDAIDAAVKRGLDYLDAAAEAAMKKGSVNPYTWLVLQRTGPLASRQQFGAEDWMVDGITHFIKVQRPNGSFAQPSDTAMALLFMAIGDNDTPAGPPPLPAQVAPPTPETPTTPKTPTTGPRRLAPPRPAAH